MKRQKFLTVVIINVAVLLLLPWCPPRLRHHHPSWWISVPYPLDLPRKFISLWHSSWTVRWLELAQPKGGGGRGRCSSFYKQRGPHRPSLLPLLVPPYKVPLLLYHVSPPLCGSTPPLSEWRRPIIISVVFSIRLSIVVLSFTLLLLCESP